MGNAKEKSLLERGMEKLGLAPHEVFASGKFDGVRAGEVWIVTNGGQKVKFTAASVDDLKPLHPQHAGRKVYPSWPPPPSLAPKPAALMSGTLLAFSPSAADPPSR